MNSKYILWIGAIVSALYIFVIVLFQGNIKAKESIKYLFILDDSSVVVVAKLPDNKTSHKLISSLESKCKSLKCSIDNSFSEKSTQDDGIEFFEVLQEFALSRKLTHASLVAVDNEVEINFLLENQDELLSLKKIYEPYHDKFFIKDNSSVIKVFDVSSIESDINEELKKNLSILKVLNLDLKTKKLLNQIFRKIKALGVVKVDFMIDTDKSTKKLEEYILKNYTWIKDINITKSKKNNITIKEVQ